MHFQSTLHLQSITWHSQSDEMAHKMRNLYELSSYWFIYKISLREIEFDTMFHGGSFASEVVLSEDTMSHKIVARADLLLPAKELNRFNLAAC